MITPRILVSLVCVFLFVFADIQLALANSNTEVSQELTTLYRAARKVISVNQQHINDASIGDKQLSGKLVAEQALANYAEASGSALDTEKLTDAQSAMLKAVEDVMDENQELINEQGVGFKGFLPAIFARQVANKFSASMAGKMKIKLTAPKSYVRNRANRPDKWEHNVIETMFKRVDYQKGTPFSEEASVKGKEAFRFILPEYYGKSCLGCHGMPKGERDITGGKKEGGVLGELGGAISLIIYQ
ncbi:DUF3365 domain-containing protein [Shewanella eurypsychrophilus]|uniref:DUF3365 domain-containing protein n=1 Tax=Shewanella eurypsychrophilus TaxID=2593656 RepID=A0ABX6V6B5_9GAMM|nr:MULTISPECIES: DUF3365 domain-containing protein [Shewanella]QFU22124.1 DUF3365 domain-containing protein [Shewanella sp. YLB-09]QPG57412.1 DUF3365 domain-containing protein [Shewanella eurypsychrophilus]